MTGGAERTAIVHRAVRVAVAASAGFYTFLYGLDEPVMALYALFAPISLGILSRVPGSGRQRAVVMLKALPIGLVLVALGTALAVRTWAAVLGMLVVGFLLAFAAVAGPRPAGVAPGLQLFYILACFPPYAPETLGLRLAGLTTGVLLLVACEVLLLPAPTTASYRERLAEAVDVAAVAAADPFAASAADLRSSGRELRLSQLPPAERPAGPWRTDRAMFQAGSAARRLLDQLAHFADMAPPGGAARPDTARPDVERPDMERPGGGAVTYDAASASLLRRVAALCTGIAAALRAGTPPPAPGVLEKAIRGFQELRVRQATGPPEAVPAAPVLRRQAAVLGVAESARILETAVLVGTEGRRTAPIPPQGLFWYADASTARLWTARLFGNVSLQSVQFQNAARIALGLGAARLVAGSLDLTHGFWVLLAVLTLGRTTVGATWTAVRKAVAGNLVGAVAAGALIEGIGRNTEAYAAILAPGMLVAFALGPLLGIAWAQGLFTLVVASAFAQIAPASWHLAEARIIDVVTGSVIGLLCGLLAWPAGARREVRRTMAALLRCCGPLITGTVRVLLTTPPGARSQPPSTWPTLHRLRLAEAAYDQYRSEPGGDQATALADWHAVLITANQVILGAHWLPRVDVPAVAVPPAVADWARTTAGRLAATTERIAALATEDAPRPRAPDPTCPPPAEARPLPMLIDLEMWLNSLTAQLARIEGSVHDTAHAVIVRGGPGS
ncbi:FUSC family protein [Streptomyces sp. NPDC059909]|uniref:FUSC family protein n=1 Tax=Streptomyces sp. NPDC059909 TaxID=3346998 RepID=UPI003664E9F6